eukprot:COSAG06_NODE_20436_length_796_cov_0.746055_2_plen_100_part_01
MLDGGCQRWRPRATGTALPASSATVHPPSGRTERGYLDLAHIKLGRRLGKLKCAQLGTESREAVLRVTADRVGLRVDVDAVRGVAKSNHETTYGSGDPRE